MEILLSGLWDPSSGNLFAKEGDQQRFWKITRKFVEQMAAVSGSRVKAVWTSPRNPAATIPAWVFQTETLWIIYMLLDVQSYGLFRLAVGKS